MERRKTPKGPRTFSIDDLFSAGLGCDLAGAYLLGRGLLVTPGTIVRRSTPYYDFSVPLAFGQAQDRIDAIAGIGVLITGFALQAIAYTLELGLGLSGGSGSERALVAAAVAFGAAVLVLCSERLTDGDDCGGR